MDLEEHTIDDALERRCETCGVELTDEEILAAREAGGPFLCTVHATEELSAQDDPADAGTVGDEPPAGV